MGVVAGTDACWAGDEAEAVVTTPSWTSDVLTLHLPEDRLLAERAP